MRNSAAIRNFLLAFSATAAIIVVGASLANSGDDELSADSTTSASGTDETPDAAPGTEGTAPTSSTATTPVLTPFVVADLDGYCAARFGAGYRIDFLPDDRLGCSPGQQSGSTEIDINAPCVAQVGDGSRSIAPAVDNVWRCSPLEQLELGSPDYVAGCKFLYGDQSRPTLWANDWAGWRCAALPNGIYKAYELSLDEICAITFGADSLGGSVDETADGWRCYGA